MRHIAALALSFLLLCGCAAAETVPEYDATPLNDAEEIAELFPTVGDVQTLYISTLETGISSVSKEEYVQIELTSRESGLIEVTGEIKGRGNASWSLPQRPYTVKLETAAELCGMAEGKSWVLITLFYDKTLLRNYLTLNLAVAANVASAIDCRFVNVFFDGEYNGLYLLTEKIQDNKNRVDISKKDGDALFEIEMPYRHDYSCADCIELDSGVHITFKDPEPSDLKVDEFRVLKRDMNKLLREVDNAIMKGDYDKYAELIDIDSFVNWYIVNEFVKNYDSVFVTSCYCYMKDGKLYMGPAWDYDTCLGNQDVERCMNPVGYHVSNSPWYWALKRNERFTERLKERWRELNESGVFTSLTDEIDTATQYLSASSGLQFDRWYDSLKSKDLRGANALFTYEEELDYLKQWINKRIGWLEKEWG